MRVVIPNDIYQKIMWWVFMAKNEEVSGFGTVVLDKEKREWTVKSAILLAQENTSVDTEIDGGALAKAMYQLRDAEGEIKWWWHSHHSMGVFWSQTDMNAMKQLGMNGWILATVFNNKYEYRSAYLGQSTTVFGMTEDFRDNIKTDVINFIPQDIIKQWEDEYHATVKKKEEKKPTMGFGGQLPFEGISGGRVTPEDLGITQAEYDQLMSHDSPEYQRASKYFSEDPRFTWRHTHFSKKEQAWLPGRWILKSKFTKNPKLEDEIWEEKYAEIDADELLKESEMQMNNDMAPSDHIVRELIGAAP